MGTLAPAVYKVMLTVNEESGLYELPDDLADELPETTREERVHYAKSTLLELFNKGLIEVWMAEWPRTNLRQVTADDIEPVLNSAATWQMLTESQRLYYYAVFAAAGKQAWINGDIS